MFYPSPKNNGIERGANGSKGCNLDVKKRVEGVENRGKTLQQVKAYGFSDRLSPSVDLEFLVNSGSMSFDR